MTGNRSKFKPHWSLQIILGLLFCIYLFLSFKDNINGDPAIANVIRKMVLIHLLGIYLIWFLVRSAVDIKIRLGIFFIISGVGIYFYTQYKVVGYSGLLNPEFEKAGSRSYKNADPLKNFIYDQNAKLMSPVFSQFLGQSERSGIVNGFPLLTNWNQQPPREVWRRKVGEGLSGFAIQGDYAITMEQRGPFELVVCYDTGTGQPRWAHREEIRHESTLGGVGPRSTVLIDQNRVYAIGALGSLSCLNLKNGVLIWKKNILSVVGSDLENEKRSVPWGRSGSALLVDDKIIVPGGGKNGEYISLLAFDKQNGNLLWKGGSEQISYASPQLMELSGVQQIVSINESSVTGHQTDNGQVLWRTVLPGKTHANANCSQVRKVGNNKLFLSKAYHEGARLIEVNLLKGKWQTEEKWHNKRVMRTKFSSSIQYTNGKIVGLDERDLQSIDALTGKVLWEGERYGYGQILQYNQHIMVLSEKGELALVDPVNGRELSRFAILSGKTWCSLAIAGDYLLARNNTEAVCYKLPLIK